MQNNVNLFFAIDNNYIPFLTVSILSIKEHANKDRKYVLNVLHVDVDEYNIKKVLSYSSENFEIKFLNISEKVEKISKDLQLRDYYTLTTYYRMFIPEMFKQCDKALYLDSDIVLNEDVGKLFDIDLQDKLIGGISDGAVQVVDEFKFYTKKALGVEGEKYFNAGVILMNLKKMREIDFYNKFKNLISAYKFVVAQDQDYLNVICRNDVRYISNEWNVMPIVGKNNEIDNPKLIHYNLTAKPWHYKGLEYESYFWKYASKTEYYDRLLTMRDNYVGELIEKDKACEKKLIELCVLEANNENNYFNLYVREK